MLRNKMDESGKTQKTGAVTPSLIGSDVALKGDLSANGEVQFDGKLKGDIRCGILTLGEHSSVSGKIEAETVVIHGKVEGEIRAKNVRLSKSSKVSGDIWHADLIIESGAYIDGKCMHVDNPLAGDQLKTTESAKTTAADGNANKTGAVKETGAQNAIPLKTGS